MRWWMAALLAAGCDSGKDEAGKHAHQAPRGGTLVVLAEEFANLEVKLDGDRVIVWLLDGHAANPIRSELRELRLKVALNGKAEEVVLAAVGNVLTGETPGDTSQFEGSLDSLKGAGRFHAVLSRVVVRGREFKEVEFHYPEGNEKRTK